MFVVYALVEERKRYEITTTVAAKKAPATPINNENPNGDMQTPSCIAKVIRSTGR